MRRLCCQIMPIEGREWMKGCPMKLNGETFRTDEGKNFQKKFWKQYNSFHTFILHQLGKNKDHTTTSESFGKYSGTLDLHLKNVHLLHFSPEE